MVISGLSRTPQKSREVHTMGNILFLAYSLFIPSLFLTSRSSICIIQLRLILSGKSFLILLTPRLVSPVRSATTFSEYPLSKSIIMRIPRALTHSSRLNDSCLRDQPRIPHLRYKSLACKTLRPCSYSYFN